MANRPSPKLPTALCTVQKRLLSGTAGTRRLANRFEPALVCVRYRRDPQTGLRYTTVELVVDERPGNPAPPAREVMVRIGYDEIALRHQVKEAGGTWDAQRKLWRLPKPAIRALGLKDRVVKDSQ